MTGTAAISVLVPVYNVEKYLEQCIDSIVNQTFKDLEIIIINDGSKDRSLEIIEGYALKDPRIVVINKENSGYGNSMNRGLEKATGKYIGIVESDDWIDSDMFATLFEVAEKHKLDVARSEFYDYKPSKNLDIPTKTDYVKHNSVFAPRDDYSVFYQQPSIWANLYLKSFLDENGIRFLETPGASYQDTSFSFKVYACARRFEMIERPFYHYRTDGNSSSFQNTTKVFCVCDEYDEIWRYVEKKGLFDQYKYLIPHLQMNGYKWNYGRLASPYDEQFFERWHSDFQKFKDKQILKMRSFDKNDTNIIQDVLKGNYPVKANGAALSVIIPVYNVQRYIRKCLDSVIHQSYQDLEIICVNDGSTDGSLSILEEFAEKDPRIRIINKENGGLSSARNAGLKASTSKYVCFLDSDDWVDPETYETAMSCLTGSDVVIFGTSIELEEGAHPVYTDAEYYRIKYSRKKKIDDGMLLNTDVSAWNKIYRMKIINENNIQFPEGKLYEDYSFFWHYMLRCDTAFFLKKKFYHYLRRPGSIMASTFNGSVRAIEHMDIMKIIYADFVEEKVWEKRPETLNAMFLNCFWFAYRNVPQENRRDVLTRATVDAVEMGLSGDHTIDLIVNGDYDELSSQNGIISRILGRIASIWHR